MENEVKRLSRVSNLYLNGQTPIDERLIELRFETIRPWFTGAVDFWNSVPEA